MLTDLRHAARGLRLHPGFTAVAVITLALGIGANTALFSVADAVLLRPLPYPDPDRLAWVDGAPLRFGTFGFSGLARQVDESAVFRGNGIYAVGALNVGGDPGAERVRAATVSPGFFTALQAPPVAGRVFTEADVAAQPRLAVVSHALWERRGRSINPGDSLPINGRSFTVLGVMPPRVDFPGGSDVWIPVGADTQITGRAFAPYALLRLAPGVTYEQARVEIERINDVRRGGRPRDPRETGVQIASVRELLVGCVKPLFVMVFAAVLLVLLVACINTANLLLARVTAREREISVRRALGASRLRLVRQLLAESALLSAAAGMLALPIAVWTLDAIRAMLPATLHGAGHIAIDGRAIAATAALSALATLLFGSAPAWSLRGSHGASLLRGTTTATADPFWRRFRTALAVAELAIALVLIAGAATVVASVARLMQIDLGVSGERALTMETTLPLARYKTAEQVTAFHDRLETVVRGLPGVEAVGATSMLPGSTEVGIGRSIEIENHTIDGSAERTAALVSVTPGYFHAIGIDVVAGPSFTTSDRSGSEPVAIVSERVARTAGLPAHEILGRRIQVGFSKKPQWASIVGVTRDVRMRGPEAGQTPQIYLPLGQAPAYGTTALVVKSSGDPALLAAPLRQAIAAIDADLPLYNIRTFADVRAAFLADRRFAMTVMSAFGVLATVLACVGLYGVLSYLVQLRTREIGIRMALGATPSNMRWEMMRSGVLHALAGVSLGGAASALLSRVVTSRIAGIEAPAPLLLAGVAAAMLAMAAIVTWIPARRATSIDPVTALRAEP